MVVLDTFSSKILQDFVVKVQNSFVGFELRNVLDKASIHGIGPYVEVLMVAVAEVISILSTVPRTIKARSLNWQAFSSIDQLHELVYLTV